MTRVDVDGRAYKVISQVKRDDRLSPESFKNYYLTASNGQSVPLSSLVSMKLETQPMSLARFSQLNSAEIGAVARHGTSTCDALSWLQDYLKNNLPQ